MTAVSRCISAYNY